LIQPIGDALLRSVFDFCAQVPLEAQTVWMCRKEMRWAWLVAETCVEFDSRCTEFADVELEEGGAGCGGSEICGAARFTFKTRRVGTERNRKGLPLQDMRREF